MVLNDQYSKVPAITEPQHMIALRALSNQYTLTVFVMYCSNVIPICNLRYQFPTSKISRKDSREDHKLFLEVDPAAFSLGASL